MRDASLIMNVESKDTSEQTWHIDIGNKRCIFEEFINNEEYRDHFTDLNKIPMLSIIIALDETVYLHVIPNSHRLIWGEKQEELKI